MRYLYKSGMAVSAAALTIAFGGMAFAADPNVQSKQIEDLQNTVQKQQQQIDQLLTMLKGAQPNTTAPAPAAALAPVAAVTVPKPLPPPGIAAFYTDAGSFVIPGTKTALKIGGFAKLDVTYDVNAGIGEAGAQSLGVNSAALTSGKAGFALPGTQAARQIGRFQESARSSRIILQSNTPTEIGDVKFYVEADFQGGGTGNQVGSNSAPLRFRLGYGTVGGWTLGEAYTLWTDRATLPGGLDLNAGAGIEGGVRAPVVQYRWDIDPAAKHQLYFALENPFNDYLGADTETFTTAATPQPTNNVTKLPDFTVKYANNSSLGRLFVTGLLRDLEVNDAGSINTAYALAGKPISVHSNALGWGINMGGKVYTGLGHKWNNVTLRLDGGEGIGRFWNAAGGYSAVIDGRGNLKTIPSAGYNVSYQHWFSDQWQSNIIWGQQHIQNPTSLIGPTNTQGLQKTLSELEINAVWFPCPWLQIGPAYYFANTTVVAPYSLAGVPGTNRAYSGTSAYDHRVQFTSIIGF